MSADNWTVCPQCYDKAMIPWREEAEKAQKLYGILNGVVIWKYSGSCTKCKISVSGSGELPFYPYPDGNKKEC